MELCLAIYKPYCTMDDGNGWELVKVAITTKEAEDYLTKNADCIIKAMGLVEIETQTKPTPKLVPMPGTEGDWNGRVKGAKV
jgi:hypothetical protein